MSLEDIREERIEKLKLLKEKGIDPYPARVRRDIAVGDFLSSFGDLEKSGEAHWVAGRVMAKREHGALLFFDIIDGSGTLQVYVKEDVIGEDTLALLLEVVDVGDFIEVHGKAERTKRREESILADDWGMLSKSLRPLPEKWHGIKDEEERLRRRYLDILFNKEVRNMVERRSRFWNAVREFLSQRGFLEVETPVLEKTTGGADAKPFETHHDALDMDVYLRISAGELWQKELMVAGFEKVFEIGRIFRNEGMDREHLQDYTQMEFYWGYADYKDGMELVKELYRFIAKETFGTTSFEINGMQVDLAGEWKEYDYAAILKEKTGIDIEKAELSDIVAKLKSLNVDVDYDELNTSRAIDTLWKQVRKDISGPGFLVGVPKGLSPLAKSDPGNPAVTQRFQPIIAGSELGNGYSELNDPLDQDRRFQRQQEMREKGDEEAQMHAGEFVEALEYGMPPTCGFGMSERVFALFSDKPVRETQIFPLMKPR